MYHRRPITFFRSMCKIWTTLSMGGCSYVSRFRELSGWWAKVLKFGLFSQNLRAHLRVALPEIQGSSFLKFFDRLSTFCGRPMVESAGRAAALHEVLILIYDFTDLDCNSSAHRFEADFWRAMRALQVISGQWR
jgi:hypothetical protein